MNSDNEMNDYEGACEEDVYRPFYEKNQRMLYLPKCRIGSDLRSINDVITLAASLMGLTVPQLLQFVRYMLLNISSSPSNDIKDLPPEVLAEIKKLIDVLPVGISSIEEKHKKIQQARGFRGRSYRGRGNFGRNGRGRGVGRGYYKHNPNRSNGVEKSQDQPKQIEKE